MLNLTSQRPTVEIIREHLTPEQVLAIRAQERSKGRLVNITRLSYRLVEIEIIHPGQVIDVTPGEGRNRRQQDQRHYLN